MNNTHTAISYRRKSSRNSNRQSIDNQYFEILGDLRESGISITETQSGTLYKTLLQKEEQRIKHEMQKSHKNVLYNIAQENAAKAAINKSKVNSNRRAGRANAANVARDRARSKSITRKASIRRPSSRRSSGYSSANANANTNN